MLRERLKGLMAFVLIFCITLVCAVPVAAATTYRSGDQAAVLYKGDTIKASNRSGGGAFYLVDENGMLNSDLIGNSDVYYSVDDSQIDQSAFYGDYILPSNQAGYYGYSVKSVRTTSAQIINEYIKEGQLTIGGENCHFAGEDSIYIIEGTRTRFYIVALVQRPIEYSLNLNNNGQMSEQEITQGTEDAVANPTRKGYKFMGWNTKPTGSGITIETLNADELARALSVDLLSFAEDDNTNLDTAATTPINLYAQWKSLDSVSPETGDNPMIIFAGVLIAISAAAVLIISRRRKINN